MPPVKPSLRLLSALLALTLLATACGDDDAGDDGSADTSITLYSGRSEDLFQPRIDGFEAETGIEVAVRYGDSADLALLIQTEGDRGPDVFISQSPGALGLLAGEDRLAELDAAWVN